MHAGWISLPQRNPVCVLELHQLCFLMLCDLICPVLLVLALRLIFNTCSACASNIEPVCQMTLRLGRRAMDNTLYLVAHCFSYTSGMKLVVRGLALVPIPTVCNLFFTALFLTDFLNVNGNWFIVLPDPMKVHLPCYQVELASAWAGGVVGVCTYPHHGLRDCPSQKAPYPWHTVKSSVLQAVPLFSVLY